MTPICETGRLSLRQLSHADAAFVLRLLNEPAFLRHIGDRGVRTLDDARRYLDDGPLASYRQHGFGLFLVEQRADGVAVGMCGVLRRETLPDPDLGFAFLPEFTGRGYAVEAGGAVLAMARTRFSLPRLLAIVSPLNAASQAVLRRLGFEAAGTVRLAADADELQLYRCDLVGDPDELDNGGVSPR
jgi:[ribosomal protein S5]-alanine N-acetyltransferase